MVMVVLAQVLVLVGLLSRANSSHRLMACSKGDIQIMREYIRIRGVRGSTWANVWRLWCSCEARYTP